jgi:hypothetical protein
VTDESDTFAQQSLSLLGVEVIGAGAICTHDPMPRDGPAIDGEHSTDHPDRSGPDVLGDIPVGHDTAVRDGFDAGEDALR